MMRAAAFAVLLALAPAAPAEEPARPKPAEPVPDEKAKEAIERFRKDFAAEFVDDRKAAVERLSAVGSPLVADVLLGIAFHEQVVMLRTAAFRGLLRQTASAKTLGPKVTRWLVDLAAANRKAKNRGDYGVVLDRKTGDVDTQSEEGKAALKAKREKGMMMAEALGLLDGLGYREKDSVEALCDFLQDGNDDLVATALGMLGKWKEWSVLKPELLELFEMYPEENSYETGGTSVDTGAAGSADQAAAKRRWMAKFGDPDKRRPRPKLVKALKKALLDITGEAIETPGALREFLKRPDVKRKVRAN
jgi:hypothetical protein